MKKALILAAGMGSRLREAHSSPKPLTLLHGETSLLRLLRQFESNSIRETAIVTGYRSEEIRSFVAENYHGAMKITWFDNQRYKEPNGVSILSAGSFVTERILLSMADHVFLGDAVPVMCQQSADSDHSLLLIDRNLGEIFDMDDATKVLTDAHGAILDIGKEIPEYNAVDTGLFCITPSLVEALSRLESPTLSEGVKLLASRGLMGTVELTGGTWQDIDTPETLAHALTLLDQEK